MSDYGLTTPRASSVTSLLHLQVLEEEKRQEPHQQWLVLRPHEEIASAKSGEPRRPTSTGYSIEADNTDNTIGPVDTVHSDDTTDPVDVHHAKDQDKKKQTNSSSSYCGCCGDGCRAVFFCGRNMAISAF
ncbi:hypothetical protein PC128_g19823 [Phytophthora cactorum]|nr:hypothetical protein PC120_g23459 [Phytophthora cactorum]KAG3044290.1 hypothetical protein PC121_g21993 [Phytophthora cactorum]KAG3165966.1 hypothetical protein PC128_g19823 [Phytophthora cactorum]KAG4040458.1 hypothetical protein PC123_g24006 [Phytophthora cactorum]